MKNTEKLKDYLIDKNDAYLLNKDNDGKVIMISGKWGSGKTHFWDNEIKGKLDKSIYISLYGKKSILDIENEVLTKSILKELPDDKNTLENLSLFGSITKNIVNIFVPNSGEKLEDIKNKLISSFGKNSLKEGTIICFDDFERKSKNVDLNDLFGFITQLAINFNCKVVIILNSDVFEGKEKEIFTTVKEKSISKYFMFNPTCEELFEIIFDEKYKNLEEYKQILKEIFVEVGIVNARILIQVLDNWLEWTKNKNFDTDFYLRYFVLVNINFILNHHMFVATLDKKDIGKTIFKDYPEPMVHEHNYENATNSIIKSDIDYEYIINYLSCTKKYNDKCIENIKKGIEIKDKDNGEDRDSLLAFINRNESLVKSLHFMSCFKINGNREKNNQEEVDVLNEINSFIETGVL